LEKDQVEELDRLCVAESVRYPHDERTPRRTGDRALPPGLSPSVAGPPQRGPLRPQGPCQPALLLRERPLLGGRRSGRLRDRALGAGGEGGRRARLTGIGGAVARRRSGRRKLYQAEADRDDATLEGRARARGPRRAAADEDRVQSSERR